MKKVILTIILLTFLSISSPVRVKTMNTDKIIPTIQDNIITFSYQYSDWKNDKYENIVLGKNIKNIDGIIDKNNIITITKAGTYIFSGTLQEGQIKVSTSKDDLVRIVLNGVTITNTKDIPIYIEQANQTTITLENNKTNKITFLNSNITHSSAIYTNNNLIINGKGSLHITTNNTDAITCNDELYLMDGNINIDSTNNGITSTKYLVIANGNYNLHCVDNAIKVVNDTGLLQINSGRFNITTEKTAIKSKNSIFIKNGAYIINSQDMAIYCKDMTINNGILEVYSINNGIQVDNILTIDKATITIKECSNGLQANIMYLDGGKITINAKENGIITTSNNNTESKVYIKEGTVAIDANDMGLYSNGNVEMIGGNVYIEESLNKQNNNLFTVNGGELFKIGSTMYTPNSKSTLNNLNILLPKKYEANTVITITDTNENVIFTYIPKNSFQSIFISSAKIETGKTYIIYMDNEIVNSIYVNDNK